MQTTEKLLEQALRRSNRVSKEVAILLIGCDAFGREFVEQTNTVVLSRHGAGIVSRHTLGVEQEMIVIHLECNREAEIRIVGQIGSEDGSYTYGVAFLDSDLDFWGIEFPSATDDGTIERRMALHCNTCGCCEVIEPGALESDIYAIHDGLLRDCKRCKRSTLWKRTPGEVADNSAVPETVVVSAKLAPPPEVFTSPAPFKNRRQHVRTRVSFTGSVRNGGLGDDLVLCENVSRGGVCFKSSRRYYETAGIEVAAPYSPGSPCILLPARIVYVQEFPQEKMFRYGAQYLHLTTVPRL